MADYISSYTGEQINEAIRRILSFEQNMIAAIKLNSSVSTPYSLNLLPENGTFMVEYVSNGPVELAGVTPIYIQGYSDTAKRYQLINMGTKAFIRSGSIPVGTESIIWGNWESLGFSDHIGNTEVHVSAGDKVNWADKYTKNEIDNKLSVIETNIDWKEAVDTFTSIATTYPNPQDGWTVNVKDTDYTYRYNGTEWIAISANAIPKATGSIDGLMAKEDKTKLDGIQAGANNYIHPDKHDVAMITGLPTSLPANGGNSTTVNGHTVYSDVPANAKFTDTIYNHPTTHPASMITQDANNRFVTDAEKAAWNGKSNFSGNYNDLTSKPTIPTSTNQLINNSGFITINDVPNEITVGVIKPTDGSMWYEVI